MPLSPRALVRRCSFLILVTFALRLTPLSSALSIASEQVRKLVPGATLRGTTKNAKRLVQLESSYRAGQVVFNFTAPTLTVNSPKQANQIVQVTTCSEFTQFDTVLVAYKDNFMHGKANVFGTDKPLDVNDNDCEEMSTLQLAVSPGESLFILLTGYGSAEGQYEIRANFVVPLESIPLPWGLDRIDQRTLPLNNKYSVLKGGQGVYVYVLDSGVRISHSEFQNEDGSRRAIFGTDVVDRRLYSFDGNGHGTHVAGIIAGKNVGVAKRAVIISVRVLDRKGIGYTARITEGLEWSLQDIRRSNRSPAVIAMSLSTPRSEALNEAVARITDAGIPVVTAAGNGVFDSCSFSPASEISAITVASINRDDTHSEFSNYGSCIDIYGPGEEIYSTWHTGDQAMKNLSGTSAACPHVVGTVAALLADNPSLLPAEISSVINTTSTKAAVDDHVLETNSSYALMMENVTQNVNKLVYIRPLPTLLHNPRPKSGVIFIYAVFSLNSAKYNASNCFLSSDVDEKTSELVASAVSTADVVPKVKVVLCCSGLDLAGCDIGAPSGKSRIVLQIETRDYHASSAFILLETMSNNAFVVDQLGSTLDASVEVLYEPWVVDSRGYKYWAAPSLEEVRRGNLSRAQMALLGCAVCIFAIFLIAITFFIVHKRREKRIQTEKEEFERKATEFEKSKEKASNLTNINEDPIPGYRREGIKRENTDLFGDVLKNITSSVGLVTPRFFGGLMTPNRNGQDSNRSSMDPRPHGHSYRESPFKEGEEVSSTNFFPMGDGLMTPHSTAIRRSELFTPQSSAFKVREPFSSFYSRMMETPRGLSRGRPAGNRPSSSAQPSSTIGRRGPWETGRIKSYDPGQIANTKPSAVESGLQSPQDKDRDTTNA